MAAYLETLFADVRAGTLTLNVTAPITAAIAAAELRGMRIWAPAGKYLVSGGFVGTMFIIRPGGDSFSWATLLPLGLVFCNSWFQVLTSKMARTEKPETMHFYTGWVGTAVISLALPFVWTWELPLQTWALLLLLGLFATVGHFVMILAYQRAPAAALTPYLYTQIAFAMLGGWLVFSHIPDSWTFIGMALIAVCGVGGAWLAFEAGRGAA